MSAHLTDSNVIGRIVSPTFDRDHLDEVAFPVVAVDQSILRASDPDRSTTGQVPYEGLPDLGVAFKPCNRVSQLCLGHEEMLARLDELHPEGNARHWSTRARRLFAQGLVGLDQAWRWVHKPTGDRRMELGISLDLKRFELT